MATVLAALTKMDDFLYGNEAKISYMSAALLTSFGTRVCPVVLCGGVLVSSSQPESLAGLSCQS